LDKNELYKQYQGYLSELMALTSSEDSSQNSIAQEERNIVAEVENEYLNISSELQRARQMITSQYRSVWESCTSNAGLRRPADQRPAYTDINWKECIRIQEQAAREIQEWFAIKSQQAIAERQKKLQQEAERKAAMALSAAEAERKRKEEAAALEKARGALLLEEMKRRFRNNS
jgi:hypothetical protein